MNLKVVAGIILVVGGLGLGVIEWLRSGFTTPYPMGGLAATAIGIYLIADGLRRKPSKQLPITGQEALTAAGLIAGVIGGTLLVEHLRGRQSKISNQELLELERQLEEARLLGRIPPDKYAVFKAEIESIKKKRGLK
ncbi:MAG: hypothetical protein ABWK01_03280 [Infirmifilum sp.]